jgi:adenylate kinase family enzyme
VWVVGCAGAGKSTFSRDLAARLGVPHVEMDGLFHGPRWTPTPIEIVRARVAEWIAQPGWVMDGNYNTKLGDLPWSAADTVVWLDPPRHVVMRSVLGRTLGRIARRTELWNGNREHVWFLFDPRPRENVVLWAWVHFSAVRRRYGAAFAAPPPGQTWHRFRTREAAWTWLAGLPERTEG